MICVGVSARFVPSGAVVSDGTVTLRGTVVLSPIAGVLAESCGATIELASWPSRIEALLPSLEVLIEPVPKAVAERAAPPKGEARIRLHATRAHPIAKEQRERDVAYLEAEWQRLMLAGGLTWDNLATALAGGDPAAGGTAQAAAGTAPDVLATGGGQMSVLLALERARSLLERIRAPEDNGGCAQPGPETMERPAERLRTRLGGRETGKPWLPRPFKREDLPAEDNSKLQRLDAKTRSKQTDDLLRDERKIAARQAAGRSGYTASGSAKDVGNGLEAMAGLRPACDTPGQACAAVAAPVPGDALQQSLDRVRTLHYAGTRADVRQAPVTGLPDPRWKAAQTAHRRLFALMGQPALARLFNLAIDVAVTLTANSLASLGDGLPCGETVRDALFFEARFAFVSARLGRGPGQTVWTTTKLRLPWSNTERLPDDVLLFWACTREELDARSLGWTQNKLLALSVAGQIDGMVDLGAARPGTDASNPRFELATLDPRRAAELDLQADALASRRGGLTAVTTLPSGGLLLIDRWRQFHAVARAADTVARSAGQTPGNASGDMPIVVDAEALTVGYRLDVAIDTGRRNEWRSLVERRIVHDRDPKLDKAMERLVPDAAERRALDAASLTLTTRSRQNTDQDGSPGPSAFADEILAQWHGAPLGVDLHGMDAVSSVSDEINDGYVSLLHLSQEFSMAQDGPDRPVRQCFGWSVRVGLRPQLVGGVVRPLQHAARSYDAGRADRFALPPAAPGVRGRRLLRHERIEHPIVTTPLGILTRIVDGPQETALELVVRSAFDPVRGLSPLKPAATHRVFVPPPVSMVLADQHDVFSEDRLEFHMSGGRRRRRPRGGLRDLAYDRMGFGTFPVWSTQQDSVGALYPDERLIVNDAGVPDAARMTYPLPTGDAVFMPIEPNHDPADRRQPYYPDPAAELMVFRLRHEDGSDLPGESLVVRVRRPGVTYPDVTPIMVEVVRGPTRADGPKPAGMEDFGQERLGLDVGTAAAEALAHGHTAWTKQAARIFLDGTAASDRRRGKIEATRVVVRLRAGERLQLDSWCLPRPESLAYLFDIVESAAATVAGSVTGAGAGCLSGTAFCERLAAYVGRPPYEILAIWHELIKGRNSRAPSGPCAAGQLLLPGPDELRLVAEVLYQAATDVVSPELAARLTVWVTHAIDRPLESPNFAVPSAPAPLGLVRVDQAGVPGTDASTRVELSGWVGFQQASTRFLEVEASGPSLITGTFDNPQRGRSTDDQARGIWPTNGTALVGKEEHVIWRKPGEMFGFGVAPTGLVKLLDEKATLMRIDDIPERPAPGGVANMMDLTAMEATLRPTIGAAPAPGPAPVPALAPKPLPIAAPNPSPLWPGATAKRPQAISDLKARVVTINLVAGSRTAPLIRERDGTALEAERQTLRSDKPTRIALQAAAAPARVAPLTILPAFRLDQTNLTVTRRTRLRIRVRRPWFSSGAGERLGIVLWPPDFHARVVGSDLVRRDTDVEPGYPGLSEMEMAGFSDLDLGPGGDYVTRWGGDPTKDGAAPASWLVPPSAFRQAEFVKPKAWQPWEADADDAEVVYVPRVSMPLPQDKPILDKQRPPPPVRPSTMEVALLTLVPRFDVDLENWYFDLEIDPGAAAEPFIRLGLVRYQWNAPPELRVSEPVIEWAQLLPQRTVTVSGPVRTPSGEYELKVVVSGVTGRQRSPPASDRGLQPTMEMEAWRYDRNDIPARLSYAVANPTDNSPPGSEWQGRLTLSEDPSSPADGAKYVVTVTEHNVMRPASYSNEPIDPIRDTDEKSSSGPRFAARVDIPPPSDSTGPEDESVLFIHTG